jgi:anti-sigma B factor antagonist
MVHFWVRSAREGAVHRLTPVGELDIATTPILDREFDAAFSLDELTVLVIDLTELSFMDSTGISLLVRMSKRCPDRLRVINGSPAVERILDITGVRPGLPIIKKDSDPLAPLP